MSIESILSLLSLAVGIVGFFSVIRAYRETVKSADIDMERLRRFVDSAPIEHLKKIKLTKVASDLEQVKAD